MPSPLQEFSLKLKSYRSGDMESLQSLERLAARLKQRLPASFLVGLSPREVESLTPDLLPDVRVETSLWKGCADKFTEVPFAGGSFVSDWYGALAAVNASAEETLNFVDGAIVAESEVKDVTSISAHWFTHSFSGMSNEERDQEERIFQELLAKCGRLAFRRRFELAPVGGDSLLKPGQLERLFLKLLRWHNSRQAKVASEYWFRVAATEPDLDESLKRFARGQEDALQQFFVTLSRTSLTRERARLVADRLLAAARSFLGKEISGFSDLFANFDEVLNLRGAHLSGLWHSPENDNSRGSPPEEFEKALGQVMSSHVDVHSLVDSFKHSVERLADKSFTNIRPSYQESLETWSMLKSSLRQLIAEQDQFLEKYGSRRSSPDV